MIDSFLFFNPFSKLPFGSFASAVNGFPFFRGLLTSNNEKAVLAAVHANMTITLAAKQRRRVDGEYGRLAGGTLVRGRL